MEKGSIIEHACEQCGKKRSGCTDRTRGLSLECRSCPNRDNETSPCPNEQKFTGEKPSLFGFCSDCYDKLNSAVNRNPQIEVLRKRETIRCDDGGDPVEPSRKDEEEEEKKDEPEKSKKSITCPAGRHWEKKGAAWTFD